MGLRSGVTLRRRIPGNRSRLITAALIVDMNVINRLIRTEYASLTDVDYEFGWTALHWAASNSSNPMLSKLLIDSGTGPELMDDSDLSTREIAASRRLAKFEEWPHLDEFATIFNISASYLEEIGLNSLHRAALGIASVDLRG
ncbi:hypothetical protein F4776DRAFT_605192, partial [Hypoxylon sp. NC0597]